MIFNSADYNLIILFLTNSKINSNNKILAIEIVFKNNNSIYNNIDSQSRDRRNPQ